MNKRFKVCRVKIELKKITLILTQIANTHASKAAVMANTRKYEKKESFPVLIMLGDGRGGDIGEYQQFSVQRRNNKFL